jgi:hypothetical protein
MTVKLAILKSGENIISNIKEGLFEEKKVCYILENPYKVTITGSYKILDQENDENQYSISLRRWPTLSKDSTIELHPNYIVSLVEPVDNLKELYETQVLGIKEDESNESTSTDEQPDSNQSD